MSKSLSKPLSKSLPVPTSRVSHFSKLFPKTLPPKYRAAVGYDSQGSPSWFLFDMYAFWEFICRIDSRMFDELPEKEYDAVSLGSMIDKIEERWPFSEKSKAAVRKEYERALEDIKEGRVSPV